MHRYEKHSCTEHTECQAFCPFVRIGFTMSIAPPLWVQGGRPTRLRGRGWGDPIPTKRQTLWYSMYTIVPLRIGEIVRIS